MFIVKPTPHTDASKLIEGKPILFRNAFDNLLPELRGLAFTVSGIDHFDTLQRIRDQLAEVPKGALWDDVQDELIDIMNPYFVDPSLKGVDDKEYDKQVRAVRRRANLLIRTHSQQVYSATSYEILDRQRKALPYWQYQTMGDDRVRDTHRALNNVTLPHDHPFWNDHYAPWGWGCRCTVIGITRDEYGDIREEDEDRPSEDKWALDDENLENLENGQLWRNIGGNPELIDIRSDRAKGDVGGWAWHPEHFGIRIKELKERYDRETFKEFETWAKGQRVRGINKNTIWGWLGGKEEKAKKQEKKEIIGITKDAKDALKKMSLVGEKTFKVDEARDAVRDKLRTATGDDEQELLRQLVELTRQRRELTEEARSYLFRDVNVEDHGAKVVLRVPRGAANKRKLTEERKQGLLQKMNAALLLWAKFSGRERTDKKKINLRYEVGRAGYIPSKIEIQIDHRRGVGTYIHELAHFFEDLDASLLKRSAAFLKKRAGRERPKTLRSITGINYDSNEVAIEDDFQEPYMGKIYNKGGDAIGKSKRGLDIYKDIYATEILSMGLQYFWEDPLEFARKDPDFFTFIYETLRK